jgi:hypothetical protein
MGMKFSTALGPKDASILVVGELLLFRVPCGPHGASSRPQKLLNVSELTAASEAELGLKNT